MKTIHRVSMNSSLAIQRELSQLGVDVGAEGLASFKIEEQDERWPAVHGWLQERQALDVVSAVFSSEEVHTASWVELLPSWHCGYPQPDDGQFGFRKSTYDLSDWCETCGMGAVQNTPFQMKRAPKWGRRGITQLHWVFDEFFVTPAVWKEVFKPSGVGARGVVDVRGVELEGVVQLDVPERVNLVEEEIEGAREVCSECCRVRFSPQVSTWLPSFAERPSAAMLKSSQHFGSGGTSFNRVIISAEIVRALGEARVKGCSFRPGLPSL